MVVVVVVVFSLFGVVVALGKLLAFQVFNVRNSFSNDWNCFDFHAFNVRNSIKRMI